MNIAADITEIDTTELNEHLKLLIQINKMLVTVIDNLQKVSFKISICIINMPSYYKFGVHYIIRHI